MRFFPALLLLLLLLLPAPPVGAQQRDSFFADYQAYARFVDSRVMNRDFIELIQVLGGRDEYTPEQLQEVNRQFLLVYPHDFSSRAVLREVDLGQGFRQEMRAYWGDRTGYNYFYALLHLRDDGLVVLNFSMNSDVSRVMAEF